MLENDVIIRLENVSKAFDGSKVLTDISLSIRSREFLTFLGPSGCGKTTLLRLIAGFEIPTEGRVYILGKDVTDHPPNKRNVNTVFQNYALFPHMTVFNNVAFGLKMSGVPGPEIERRVHSILKLVQLDGMSNRKPRQLSGGQQQRVAVARAAVNNPLVLLLDEPLSALDAKLRKQMQRELKQLQKQLEMTFVFVTHDQQEALSISDRLAVMDNGRIIQLGTPQEIYEEPVNLNVAEFVGETNILDGIVLGMDEKCPDGSLRAEVEGTAKPCLLNTRRRFLVGQRIKVVLRPEDILVYRRKPPDSDRLLLKGCVDETIYKGTTYDIAITLFNGKHILVTEFFDEDDEDMIVSAGQDVYVSWIKGWEVVLPDEREKLL